MENRPTGRNKKVIGNGGSVQKRGQGLGTGPVGNQGGYKGRSNKTHASNMSSLGNGSQSGSGHRMVRGGGGSGKLFILIAIVAVIFFMFKGSSGLDLGGTQGGYADDLSSQGGYGSGSAYSDSNSFGGLTSSENSASSTAASGFDSSLGGGISSASSSMTSSQTTRPGYSLFDILTAMSGYSTSASDYDTYSQNIYGYGNSASTMSTQGYSSAYGNMGSYTTSGYGGALNTSVDSSARQKRTQIYGNGQDKVTIMVYMCGTDLESKSGMASSDLKEMTSAKISDDVNLIVYTGGCSRWQNSIVSSSVNQIYEVKQGGVRCVEENMGKGAMTDPDTLTTFIKYCTQNYPANRQELIFWDHGSGSVSGYGYDEKNQRAGSMTLAGINTALKNAGTTFDFIGFDACLMATVENAMMLSSYADYMIASEETEPGIGWYYTNWLTKLSQNTATPTIEVGQAIIDDFVDVCDQRCRGQKATLSIVDLAELEKTLPADLTEFSKATSNMLKSNDYKTVSDARNNTKEFAASSKIDQIDLIDFANKLGTDEAKELVKTLESSIKYNRTSTSIANAYGLSIYFPYKKVSKLDSLLKTYDSIGMDSEYSKCIKEFAQLELNGQMNGSGTTSAIPSLLGGYAGSSQSSSSYSSSYSSSDMIFSMLDSFGFFGRSASEPDRYVEETTFDNSQILWNYSSDGKCYIHMDEEQWSLVENIELNVFYDDGEGYVDLGMDNVFEFTQDGDLIGDYDRSWMSIDGQIVPYYYLGTDSAAYGDVISGYVPAFLNGERVNLILSFDDQNPYGYIAGAEPVYVNGETETIAKNLIDVGAGDTLEFICDYYTYSGEYKDSYLLGEPITLGNTVSIGNLVIDDGRMVPTYCFTDIYQLKHWTLPF